MKFNFVRLKPGSYLFTDKNVVLDVSSSKIRVPREQLTNHLDFYCISETTSIGIDAIRGAAHFLRLKPSLGEYKILVIEHFHLATDEAQNAFLKTLEEPPEYAYIFLVTPYIDRLLKTIVSRAQVIGELRIKNKELSVQVKNQKLQRVLEMNVGERFLWLENELKGLDDKKVVKAKLLEIIDEFLIEAVETAKQDNIFFDALDYAKEARWKIEQNFPNPKILVEGLFTLLP